jgi:hypothetical protein
VKRKLTVAGDRRKSDNGPDNVKPKTIEGRKKNDNGPDNVVVAAGGRKVISTCSIGHGDEKLMQVQSQYPHRGQ